MNLESVSFLPCSEESLKKFDIQVKDKKELIALINESIYRKCAKTSKEKFEVLDLRDKMLKLIRYEITNIISGNKNNNDSETIVPSELLVGTCQDMCPEKERYSREYLSLCHKYEMRKERSLNDITDIVDPRLMIKEYSRSSADQDLPLPNEMRPINVLYHTMIYLIDEIIAKIANEDTNSINENGSDFSIVDWYDFVWNRTRSIRKDIIQQRLLLNDIDDNQQQSPNRNKILFDNEFLNNGLGGVLIIEQHARFHILCAHRLCEQGSQVFDFKINEENLKNCFQSLRQYYEITTHNKSNNNRLKPSPNESEFRSYIILLNLSESNIGLEVKRWPSHLRHSKHVSFALSIYNAYNTKNYIKFFRLIRDSNKCEYLQACILHRYFYMIRCQAFKTIFAAYKENKDKVYPLSKLADNLGFDSIDEAVDYCNAFGLDIIEGMVTMRSSMSYNDINLSKSDEDRLKARRSLLLVENKFLDSVRSCNYTLTHQQLLGEIISGLKINVNKKPSKFGSNNHYELTSSFDDQGYFTSDEIEQFLAHAKYKLSTLNQISSASVSISNIPKLTLHLKSISHNKPAVANKIASNLVRKAQLNKSISKQHSPAILPSCNDNPLQVGIKDRRKSSSSNSSSDTVKSTKTKKNILQHNQQKEEKNNRPFIGASNIANKPNVTLNVNESNINPFKLINSGATLFGGQKSSAQQASEGQSLFKTLNQQPTILFGGTQQTSSLSSKLKPSNFSVSQPTFSTFGESASSTAKTNNIFSTKPTLSGFGQDHSPNKPVNLFENAIKKQESQLLLFDSKQQQQQQQQQQLKEEREKKINQKADSFFQSIYLELIREICAEYLFKEIQLSETVLNNTLDYGLNDLMRKICQESVLELKQERERLNQIELIRQKKANEEQEKNKLINLICNDFILNLTDDIIEQNCINYLKMMRDYENLVYEDIICNVFQKEFDIIIKQIANELNNEILFNRLAESIYFNYSENPLDTSGLEETSRDESSDLTDNNNVVDLVNSNSIYMNDLRSFLHECIFEFTRLNLNINRELYYELNQALKFNQQMYLFKKWRLKLSLKLLNKAQRRTSFNLKQTQHQQSSSSLDLVKHKEHNQYGQQLHLITFLISYGKYLLDHLSKFHKISSFFIVNSDYTFDNESFQNKTHLSNLQTPANILSSIIHCEQYRMYLTWNLNLNYKNYLNEIMLDNYYNIIHNRDNVVLIPIPKYNSHHQDSDSLKYQNDNNQMLVKTIFAMESLSTSSNHNQNDEEAIKRWLMSKLFHFDSKKTYSYETKRIENASINLLKSEKYGIKFCMKYHPTQLDQTEYDAKLKSRSLYGSCSLIYVLMPLDENDDFQIYLNKNRSSFMKILGLFDENIQIDINSYEYMFVSYLNDHDQTRMAIEFMLNTINAQNYCYCLLEGDVLKDDGVFQQTYKYFLQKICNRFSLNKITPAFKKVSNINNVDSIANIIQMTIMKFFDFLSNHPLSKSSIQIPLESIINEFNLRVEKIIDMLAKQEYTKYIWPIPEFIDNKDEKSDISLKTLKYWNSKECIEDVLRSQLKSLIYLNQIDKDELSKLNNKENDLIRFETIEKLIFKYSNDILMSKERMNKIPSQSECIDSIFQLENKLKIELDKIKKLNFNNSLYISISKIEWFRLLAPIFEYLLTNGYLKFQNEEKIYLSQFLIYFNISELKSYDWINNQSEMSQEIRNDCYLCKNYPKKDEKPNKNNNLKRRYTDDHQLLLDEEIKQLEELEVSSFNQQDLKDKSNLIHKYQRFDSPESSFQNKPIPIHVNLNESKKEISELDLKINKFFDLLNSEKENNFKFDDKLDKLKSSTNVIEQEESIKKVPESNKTENVSAETTLSNSLESFFKLLNEEKIKNEQFNAKLNQILD